MIKLATRGKKAISLTLAALVIFISGYPARSQTSSITFPPTGEMVTYQMPAANRLFLAPDNSLFTLNKFFASYDGGLSWRNYDVGEQSTITGVSLAVAPNFSQERRLWFGTIPGLYIADNGEGSWRRIPSVTTSVRSIAVSPNFAEDRTLFIGSTDLMLSTNGGDDWQNINLGFTPDVKEVQLSPDFPQDGLVFFTTNAAQFYVLQMTSGSAVAQPTIPTTGGAVYVSDFVVSPALSADQRIFISTTAGVFRSDDLGATWALVSPKNNISRLFIAPNYPNQTILFAIEEFTDKLLRSINNGKDWSVVLPGEFVSDLVFSNSFPVDQTVKALTGSGLWMSTTAGGAWNRFAPTLPTGDHALEEIALSPDFENDGTLFAGPTWNSSYQLYRSTDFGFTLTPLALPEELSPVYALSGNFPTDQTVFLAFNDHLYKSTNAGSDWIPLPNLPFYAQSLVTSPQFASDQTLFLRTNGNGLHRSTNGGASWQIVSGLPTYLTDVELSPGYPADPTIYAVSGASIFVSHDDGANWDYATSPDIIGGFNLELSDAYVQDQTLFAADEGNSDGGIFRSSDGAVTWQQVGFFPGFTSTFAISPHFSTDHTLMAASIYGPLYISENSGDTWLRLYGIPYFPGGYAAAFGAGIGYQDNRLQLFSSQGREFYRFTWYPTSTLQLQAVTLWADPGGNLIPAQQVLLSVENWVRPGFVVSEDLPWLEISPITGTIPSNISFTGDLSGEALPLTGEFTVDVHWSTNNADHYQIPIQVLTAAQRIHLPVVLIDK